MTKFDGKTCLITGAASGLGRATAFAAAAKGASLVLTDITADALATTAEELRANGAKVHLAHPADVSDHSAVVGLAAHTFDAVSHVDIVMNVAGIATWGTVDKLTPQQWRRTVDINLMGPIHIIEEFITPMITAGRGGHLVNVSSAAGIFGLPWHAPYSATKFGLRGVSEVLRFDLRRHKIGVSLVCPGAMSTPMVDSVDIAGIDRDNAALNKAIGLFMRHAVTPDQAATAVIKGVERNRYWVYTSRDIQLAHWGQRYVPYGYTLAMRALNSAMTNYVTKNELVR